MAVFTVYFGIPGKGDTEGVTVDEWKFSQQRRGEWRNVSDR